MLRGYAGKLLNFHSLTSAVLFYVILALGLMRPFNIVLGKLKKREREPLRDIDCNHHRFGSPDAYFSSFLEKAITRTNLRFAAERRNDVILVEQLENEAAELMCHPKVNMRMRTCLQCAVLSAPLHCIEIRELQQMNPLSWSTRRDAYLLMQLWALGAHISHPKIARHYFGNSVFPMLSICTMLKRFELVVKYYHIWNLEERTKRMNRLHALSWHLVINIHNFSRSQWLEYQMRDNIIIKLLDAIILHFRVCCEHDYGLDGLCSNVLNVLLVSAARAVWDDKTRWFLGILKKDIVHRLKMHQDTVKRVSIELGRFGCSTEGLSYFSVITPLFDLKKGQRPTNMFKRLSKIKRQCKIIENQQYSCNNVRCRKGKGQCKYFCSKCRTAIYCSRKCQKYDWKKGQHRKECPQYVAMRNGARSLEY